MSESTQNSPAVPATEIADVDREIAARQLQLAVEDGELDLAEVDKRLAAVSIPRAVRPNSSR
ncbi:DUF1707 domain-containing protein [Nocardia sp. NPDC005366]|uniref:DUF1707 domain-containing protein n=1 Tax=Nocardia sp. NPDC005366 TaxID=3156878 RepID=UPI0033B12583